MSAVASSIAAQLDMNAGAAGDAVWLTSPDTGATVTWAADRSIRRLSPARMRWPSRTTADESLRMNAEMVPACTLPVQR